MNSTSTVLLALLVAGHWLPIAGAAASSDPPKVVAHRGLLNDAPENTLAGFRARLELRFGFEVDVRRSKDGVLVCVHDESVDRTTDGRGKVSELTLEQLKSLDAGSWFGALFEGEPIPTLQEVFALIADYRSVPALVAVDLKGDDPQIETDCVELARRNGVLDRLLFIGRAINQADVRRRLRAADQRTHVACLANVPEQFDGAVRDPHADWVYVRYVPRAEQLDAVRLAGRPIFIAGTTVAGEQPENWRRAQRNGLAAILTDHALQLARQIRDDRQRRAQISEQLRPHFSSPEPFRDDFGPYRSPLIFADGRDAKSRADWQKRRAEILADWHAMMGPWPDLLPAPNVRYLSTERREDFTQHRVEIEIYPGEQYTEGHLLIPDGPGPFPAVLVPFYESRTSVGLGPRGQGTHDYGLQLVRRGFVTLSIGTPGTIERPEASTGELLTRAGENQKRQPLSFLAYVAANCHTALARMEQVDGARIGIVGLSYGGKWSMFASCLYDKFSCAVWSDPGIVFNEENANVNYWEPWYLGYEPGVRRRPGVPNADRPRTGLYKRLVAAGRDLNELHALMCPRPLLVAGGTEDPPRNWRALNHVIAVDKLLGYEQRVAMTSRKTHVPTAEALEQTLLFLEYFLKYTK